MFATVRSPGAEDTQAHSSWDLKPTEVDVSAADRHVTVRVHVGDDISGSQRPIVEFRSPDGSQEAQAILNRISGTNLDGVYEGVATIHQFAQQGTWKLNSFFVSDEVGNKTILKTAQLEAAGFPVAVQVGSNLPTVTSISPALGPEAGGTEVRIEGTDLAGATAVRFGSNTASFAINTSTSITAIAPPGSGMVDITVTTPSGTSATGPTERFSYSLKCC